MGPKSLEALMRLPLAAIEFGAYGGTNFSVLERLRSANQENSSFVELTRVGHTAEQMVESVNIILEELGEKALCQNFIISGGIQSALHAYALMQQLQGPCVFGRARAFLERADQSEQSLREFVKEELGCLAVAACFLDVEETRV
jgi:isopentenyl-diphosphate delta-isomerase